ncbi:hypothetical protein SAMN05421541_11632 [Actinoplanes philippinensis]|uniref:Uncharacterized protein n=1 Tax=Actinoplanes philippinensis TaxID=35752 RepID=A0A1I2KC49_9ACTN|nr:hypothetical protein [Actinoplanes philippinensis]SFF64023.1 hypothetical protein SAMN05421541_11632 [Actinoplanes philippinensis]
MGSRANVAVRRDGTWVHHGSNGLGYSLDAWLAPGPEPALAMFGTEAWPVWEPGQWQWESTCEAAALIDVDARELLFFVDIDVTGRLALLEAYGRTWDGWTIRWAYNGLADVTDALGLDRSVLDRDPWDNTDLFKWHRPGPGEQLVLDRLITVGDVAYGLDHNAEDPWTVGPALLDQLGDLPRVDALPGMPRGGMHLDPDGRAAGVWSLGPVHHLTERFAERWPGWTLEFWEDRHAGQAARSGWRFPDPAAGVDDAIRRLGERVLDHWLPATPENRDEWPKSTRLDPFYGMRAAGLAFDGLQRIVDVLLGPGREPIVVAEYAKRVL